MFYIYILSGVNSSPDLFPLTLTAETNQRNQSVKCLNLQDLRFLQRPERRGIYLFTLHPTYVNCIFKQADGDLGSVAGRRDADKLWLRIRHRDLQENNCGCIYELAVCPVITLICLEILKLLELYLSIRANN